MTPNLLLTLGNVIITTVIQFIKVSFYQILTIGGNTL